MNLPYGKLKAAVGFEVRDNSIDDTPALDSINGNLLNLTSATPTRGEDRAKDVFAEVDVPLLKNLPFAHELTLGASTRWANYRSYGSDSTYKIGGLWSPVKWVSVRGTSGTSYRAPALFEQFLGATSGFLNQQNDPCNNWDAPANSGTIREANCRSEGLPAGFSATSGITVLGVGGREAGLKAETSKNKGWGVIFQPPLPTGFGDLSLAVDYFDITVDNGVSRLGGAAILTRCYDDKDFRNGGGFCRLVSPREASNNALTVKSSYVNLATDVVRGYDYTARYTNDIGLGRLRMNMTLTQFKEQANKLFAEDALDNVNGTINNPDWAGALDVNYTIKGWNLYYGLEWVGKTDSYAYLEEDPATSTFKLNTPDHFEHAVSLSYNNTAEKWRVTAGVRNLADKKPPVISAQAGYNRVGNAPLFSGYDYLGRRFFVNVTKTF
jgi:iron complex outermembrane receptor protein